jgi:arsenite-transporting ATPase
VSCALAIAAAELAAEPQPVLLVSTDPAPSIADALRLGQATWAKNEALPVDDVPGLSAWQLDATLAFAKLRERYQERIDALFDALVGRGLDVAHDRGILRELLALAPPGIDELYALSSIGEALDERRFARIVVDPAPTGHLLRLLEMPALALDWTHRLMRLMLKYKDVAGLGEAAEELLAFAKRTRALDALLHDGTRAGIVLVTLAEPLVRAESIRLAGTLRASGVALLGVVENRAADRPTPMDHWYDRVLPYVVAPASPRPLIGAAAIRQWSAEWHA